MGFFLKPLILLFFVPYTIGEVLTLNPDILQYNTVSPDGDLKYATLSTQSVTDIKNVKHKF